MVQHRDGVPTLDDRERAALLLIVDADAVDRDVEVGPATEVYRRRPWPPRHEDADPDAWPAVATVETKTAHRLAKAGWVSIDAGGLVHLTDEGRAVQEADASRGDDHG